MEQHFVQSDDELISFLEGLSCMALPPSEKSRMAEDLRDIFSLVSKLDGLNTNGISECRAPLDTVNIFRGDVVIPSFNRELILKNAPEKTDEMIVAPRTVE